MSSRMDEGICEVEIQNPEDVLFWDCEKVLRAGIWLIRNGYGKMAILPYIAASGCYWRCEFHPIGKSSKVFYRYSTGAEGKFLLNHSGGTVRRDISPKGLARAIMVSVPEDLKQRCSGEVSHYTEAWLQGLERALDQCLLPQAFDDSGGGPEWKLVSVHGNGESSLQPQPGYIQPGTEPNWRDEPFWRICAAQAETLRDSGLVEVDPAMIEHAITEEIATETFRAMLDAKEYEPEQILQMAVQAVLLRMHAAGNERHSNPAYGRSV